MKVENALIDAGPLIALFDSRESHHHRVVDTLQLYTGNLISSWPVIAEALHLLSFSILAQTNLLEWIERGAVQLENLQADDLSYIKERMRKYANVPMDMADASLMCIAEKNKIYRILSLDSDFSIYRTLKGKYLQNIISG